MARPIEGEFGHVQQLILLRKERGYLLYDEVNESLPADVISSQEIDEERIIRMRFGFEDGNQRTLEEVGQVFAVTRERIRQIEAKALRKLRHPSRSRHVRAFAEGSW